MQCEVSNDQEVCIPSVLVEYTGRFSRDFCDSISGVASVRQDNAIPPEVLKLQGAGK